MRSWTSFGRRVGLGRRPCEVLGGSRPKGRALFSGRRYFLTVSVPLTGMPQTVPV